jgi:16S rRNA (cytosine1402-N4)-methyltransferase
MSSDSNDSPPKPHVRRKRYAGSHPRQFADKYKELNSEEFAADMEKVIARGQTPASTHRPICVDEILTILKPAPGEIALDVTLGFGGHTQAILPKLLPGGRLFGTDVDSLERPRTEARLRSLGYGEDVLTVREMNFADIATLLADVPSGFDCILADFGVSSMQLDNPERGFSYKNDGPLDLRLNPAKGAPASYVLQKLSAYELTQLLTDVADEPHAARIAYGIKRSKTIIKTTLQLAENVRASLADFPDKDDHKKTLARTFMALRIQVNNEFGVIDRFLTDLPRCMKTGGRVAVLSFHSGEDKRIEAAFQKYLEEGLFSAISKDCIRPSQEEQRSNSRSMPARLRWAVRA